MIEEDVLDAPHAVQQAPEPAPSEGLFRDDHGQLPADTRRALVQLLVGPSLEAKRHGQLWQILVRDQAVIRQRLSELFLELVIDLEEQVAFTRQADTGELETPLLLRRTRLTFLDSVLMLYLRQALTQSGAQGDRTAVSIEDILEHLNVYAREGATDHAGFNKRALRAIEKLKNYSILRKIRGSDDRFEVSPTLRLLLTAEDVVELTVVYRKLAESGVGATVADAEDTEMEDGGEAA